MDADKENQNHKFGQHILDTYCVEGSLPGKTKRMLIDAALASTDETFIGAAITANLGHVLKLAKRLVDLDADDIAQYSEYLDQETVISLAVFASRKSPIIERSRRVL